MLESAIMGTQWERLWIVRSENNYFTFQLNVTLTDDISAESIECIGDNRTNTHRIGLLNLSNVTGQLKTCANVFFQ